nr:MAG TPA: membrane glycoprotein [Caudoviricetes sp.]
MALNFVITKFNEWRTAIETNAQKSKDLSSSMTDLISQYKELGDKSGWDTDDFAQAKDLNAEILDLLKNQSAEMDNKLRKLDLENGKYQEQIDLLNELSISTLTQNKADQGKLLEQTAKGKSSGQYVIGDSFDTDMANTISGKFGGSLDGNTGVFNFGGFDPNDADSILAYYDKLSNALDYLGSNYDSATLEASSLYNQLKSEKNAIEDQANAYRSSSDTLKEVIAAQKLSSTSSKRSEEDIKAVTDALEGLKGAYGGVTSGNLVSFLNGDKKLGGTYADALNQLKEVMLNLGFEDNTSDAQAFVDVLVQLGIVSSSSASKVDGLSESTSAAADQLKEATDGLDKIQSAYSTLSDVVDEYNENGYLTVSTLTDLINLGPEYYDCLVNESGQLAINTENINTMADAYYEMAKAALYAQAIESLNANTNTYANASKFLSQAQQEVKDMKSLLYTEGQRLIDEGGLSGDALATQVQAQQRIINTYSAMMDLLDKTHAQSAENQFRNPKDKNSNKSSGSKDNEDKMTDAVSAWKTLSAAMEEYNQYGNLCISTLNDLLGLEDDYTSLLTEQNGKMSINTTEFKNLMFAQIAQANATDESGKSAAELKRILQYVDENVKGDTISFEQLTDAIEGYGTAMDKAKQKTDAIKSAFSGLYNVQQKIKNSQFGVGDLDATESKIESILQLSKFFGNNKDLMDNLVDKNGNINLNTEAFKKATLDELDKRIKAANKTGGAAATALANSLSSDKANIESGKISVSDYLVGLGTDLERVNTELDKYQANWNTLKDAMDEWNTTGQLTQDTMQKLQELPEEFSNLLTYDEDGNAKIDVKALRQSYVDKLSAFAKEFEGNPIGIQVQAMIDDVREPTPEEYKALAEKTVKYQKALAQYTKKMSAIDSNKDLSEDEALQQKAEVQKELDEAMEKALLEVQETDAQVTTKLKKHWDGVEKVIEEFKSALSDAKAVLSSFLSLLSTLNDKSNNDLKIWGDAMGKVIDKRIKALNKQKEALEENNEATERAIELSKAQDALARAQQQRTTRVYTENGYEWQANAEDVRTAREDLADKQREWNKKDAEKAIDDQIKKYNEFKDKLSEVMDDIGKSWKDYQKELEYTAQIQKMTLTQMEGTLDDYHNKIIASLNTGSAITGIQNLITNLESLINTLTKVNNLYSMFKTGEYKDLGTKGLWDTIKGFFNKEKSENVNKSFKDTFNAAKKAFNAGKKQLTDTATTGATDVINAMINQIKTSGNGLIETFGGIWDKIKVGAQSLFRGSGSGGGIISTFVNGFKAIGNAVSKSKIGSTILGGIGKVGTTLLSGGGKLLAGAGKLIGTAGSALAAAGPYAIPIAAAAGLGIYGGIKSVKHQKEIWSNKEDGFGKKAIKSVATFFWDISPIGAIVNLCKDISGKSKKTAENTKDTADSSSETAENTKHSATNLTINATQIVSKEENKATDETDKKNDATGNEDQTVKTAATTLTGAGLGAAAGMAIGGPAGALIGTLLGGFAGFFFGRHANGLKSSKTNHFANVDERGSELIVRKPASGRYTYLETGDGVVPADITSRLFEMGGNPDKWFSDQLAKHSSASMVQSRDAGGISLSIGDVNVNNPVGDSDALARELVNRLPNKVVQELNRR